MFISWVFFSFVKCCLSCNHVFHTHFKKNHTMSQDPLTELLQFLKPEARLDLKHISLSHLVGVSGTPEGIDTILENEDLIKAIIDLTNDKVDDVARNALLLLVNVTATSKGASQLLKLRPTTHRNIIELIIKYVLDPEKRDADAACMILSNITRVEDQLETSIDTFMPHLNDILQAFVDVTFNKKSSVLHYLGPLFSNLSAHQRIRDWLITEQPHVPLIKLLPFCDYQHSFIRRGGVIGTIKNLSFDSDCHKFLLSPDIDLLTYLLGPLMGNEDYEDDEMDTLPISLQYLSKEKEREADPDIRLLILQTLNKLCTKRECREILRDNGVYYVLREYHKWEKDPKLLLACENVVDILIQKEDEVGAEDLSKVDVPEDMTDKFDKMDKDYIESLQ